MKKKKKATFSIQNSEFLTTLSIRDFFFCDDTA